MTGVKHFYYLSLVSSKETTHDQERRTALTHLSRMNFPISIGRMSLFQILGVLGGIFHFIQILMEHSVSKQWRP